MSQTDTARTIYSQLLAHGFTPGTAAGILGNAQAESGIIADRWEGDRVGNNSGGYGLLQWTPATKLRTWAQQRGENPAALQTQINRIIWEVQTGTQFYKAGTSFAAWAASNISPEQAADDFVRYYERPAVVNSTTRQQFARQWYNTLHGTAPSAPTGATNGRNKDGSLKLVIDGILKGASISRWQEVMATPIDGVISPVSTLIKAVQTYLNKVVAAGTIKNLTGASKLVVDGKAGTKTYKVLQFWLWNKYASKVFPGHKVSIADFDGIFGTNSVKLLQYALNQATARSKKF